MITRRASLKLVAAAVMSAFAISSHAAPAGTLDDTHASVRAVMALQNEITPGLMDLPNVLGTAVGLTDNNDVALVVYVEERGEFTRTLVEGLPPQLRGHPVQVELTEQFRAFARPGGGSVSHTAKQTPPISLGTSGGWTHDLANGYCCGGTLGSLIQVVTSTGTRKFVLSNYHVLEADIVNGGNGRIAQTGDSVIQPGLIDVNCNAVNAQSVATLRTISSLPGSNVDAAIAEITPGMVREDGAILQIGAISSQTVAAFLNQAVKKSGRTSALTKSKVSGLNATVSVAYDNECAGGEAFVKTYTGQIVIANRRSGFLRGGDSGSLMVEDLATNPRAVGLLYAGSSTSAIANPIGQVLDYIGGELSIQLAEPGLVATMVGQ